MRVKVTILVSLATLVAVQVAYTYLSLFSENGYLHYKENSPHENLQAAVLFLSALFFFYNLKFLGSYNKTANLFMGLLCLTFCLREVEVEDFDIPQIFIDLFSGSGKRIILVPLWVGLALWVLKDTKIYLQNALGYIKTKFMLFIFAGAAFLMSAELFEKHFVHIEPAKFYEEFLELIGYWCVFVAAVLSRTQKQIEK